MIDNIKIATLNLCLGLKNKKEEVKRLIQTNKIDILCVQETVIPKDFPVDMLTFRGYQYENENINCKSRCGIYITNNLSYVRRSDLEIQGIHAIIIDLKNTKNTRIINIYHTFNPVNNQTHRPLQRAPLPRIQLPRSQLPRSQSQPHLYLVLRQVPPNRPRR